MFYDCVICLLQQMNKNGLTNSMKRKVKLCRDRINGFRRIKQLLLKLPYSSAVQKEIDRIDFEISKEKTQISQIYNCCDFCPIDINYL